MKAATSAGDLEEAPFHRVQLDPLDELVISPQEKPVAMWIPSGYEVHVTVVRGTVLDLSEVVDHVDIISMDRILRKKDQELRSAKKREKRARRRLRNLDRTSI